STVTTDGHGTANFTVTLAVAVSPSQFVAATATDPDNNTSAFSNCVGVAGPAAPSALASGTRQTGSDTTVFQMLIGFSNGCPRPDAEVAGRPGVPADGWQLLERGALDVLFGRQNQAELQLADTAPMGYRDDFLSSRITDAISRE